MYVLAINGSPRMDAGNTAMILNPFLEGMREASADVEIIYSRRSNVEPCSGDLGCWFEHPGVCAVKDDMQTILPKIRKANVQVWATPVYYAGVTSTLKNVMDRQLPMHIFGEEEGGQRKKIVLVSTCGAWEMEMFDPLLSQMRALYTRRDGGSDFAGALLRPHAQVMEEMMKAGERSALDGVFQAAREAGRQLVRDGRMSEDVLRSVSRPLMPQDAFYKAMNERFQQMKESLDRQPKCE